MTSHRFFDVEVRIVPDVPTATNFPLEDEDEEEDEVVEVVEEPLSLLLLHEIMVRLKRNMKKMMSICLTRFPISGLGKPKLYQNLVCFTRIGDFTWRDPDCEELVGITHRR